jgi:hypothetical protein
MPKLQPKSKLITKAAGLIAAGNEHFQLNRLNQAANCYKKALGQGLKIPEAYNNLAAVQKEQK